MRLVSIVAVVIVATASAASADPKGALGVPAGGQEATIRAAWKSWVRDAKWIEAPGPAAPVVKACVAAEATCAAGVAALQADRTWILSLSTAGEPLLVGRVYDAAGALITTTERPCTRCAANRATLTTEVRSLLDGLRESVDRLSTRLIIEAEAPGLALALDGEPIELPRPGMPIAQVVTAGAHTITATGGCWKMAPLAVTVPSGETVHAKLMLTPVSPRLRIRTSPAGARVMVDGAIVGASPDGTWLELESTAGTHRVEASKGNGGGAGAQVTVTGCETKDLELAWQPPPSSSRSKLPYLIGAGGVIALGLGVGLLVADREMVNDGNRSATYRNSAPFGYAVGGVGVAAVGVAVFLWLRDRPSETSSSSTAPSPAVAITPGGASLGVAGRF